MTDRVHVVACDGCTPVGLTARTAAAAVRAGISRIAFHPFMVDDCGDPLAGAVVASIDPKLMGVERLLALIRTPLTRLAQTVPLRHATMLPVLIAGPEHRPGWTERDEQTFLSRLSVELTQYVCPNSHVKVVERGHAGALAAVHQAALAIGNRAVEIAFVLGVDSYFEVETIDWLLAHERLVTPETRSSFVPGEGAGALLLMAEGTRRALRLPSLGEVRGTALAREPIPIGADEESFGRGMTYAVTQAAKHIDLPSETVQNIYLDLNGERYRGEEWGFVALRTGHVFDDPIAYTAPSSAWGDVGAASGALFAALATQAWDRAYASGPRTMLCAGSESSARAAIILQQSEGRI